MNTSPIEGQDASINQIPQKKKTRLVILFCILLLVIIGSILYFRSYFSHSASEQVSTSLQQSTPIAPGIPLLVATTTSTSTSQNDYSQNYIPWSVTISPDKLPKIQELLASTTASISKDKYGLFLNTGNYSSAWNDSGWTPANNVTYYDDGEIFSGPYKGYKLVMAEYPVDGIGEPGYYLFATKDYATFIADGNPSDILNPGFVNINRISAIAHLPGSFPAILSINQTFSISNDAYNPFLTQDLFASTGPRTGAEYLASTTDGLKIYAEPQQLTQEIMQYAKSTVSSTTINALTTYLDSTTQLRLCSDEGNCFKYNLSFADFANQNTSPFKPQGLTADPGDRYENLEISPGTQDSHFYNTYGDPFVFGCAFGYHNWTYTLKNINSADVFDTGRSWMGVELYAFSRPDITPIVKAMYEQKKGDSNYKDGVYNPMPSFETYIKQYPVVLFKDPWGHWVMMGENEYLPDFGCGKPVIYLYPKTPTPVKLSFIRTPKFSVDIPTYRDGWNVIAEPNGILHDLQPVDTNCAAIDTNRKGSEYALAACNKNVYPYLYWAGKANGEYPLVQGGWVVSKEDLGNFLREKLHIIGLTDTESNDMRSFWVPSLLEKNAPYYRISFFTTTQMNSFIPMKINPVPQSALRVFLDWTPLNEAPKQLPAPQTFEPFERKGFTLVEWGGLER
ncbi:MAG: hypothetical protein JWN90_194 [Parcubacteria group bacterium]|nr:hypothetical protein [Parcubacteria group bacterium]